MVLNVGVGDEVIILGFNYIVIVEIVVLLGVILVYVDVDFCLYNLDLKLLKVVIIVRIKVIIFVLLYG